MSWPPRFAASFRYRMDCEGPSGLLIRESLARGSNFEFGAFFSSLLKLAPSCLHNAAKFSGIGGEESPTEIARKREYDRERDTVR